MIAAIFVLAAVGLVVDAMSLLHAILTTDVAVALAVGLAGLGIAAVLLAAPRRVRDLSVAVLLVIASVGSVKIGASALSHHADVESVRSTIETLLRRQDMPKDVQFYLVGPAYEANTPLKIRPQFGEPLDTVVSPVSTRFVMADLAPGQMLAHPILYAIVSADGAQVLESFQREWFATIGDIPYWSAQDAMEVQGHPVAILAPPTLGRAGVDGWSASISAFLRDLTRDLARGWVAAAAGKKTAIIIDGGDQWIDVPSGPTFGGSLGLLQQAERRSELLKKLAQIEVRRAIRDQADQLAEAVSNHGYEVIRLSGLGVDPAPAPTAERIRRSISDAARAAGPDGELYVHFIAHGSRQGLGLYDKDFGRHELKYEDLAGMLSGLDPNLKKVVAINACHSGAAADALAKIAGLQMHTATSAEGKTSAGLTPAHPSWTQTLIEKLREAVGDKALAQALSKVAEVHAADGAQVHVAEAIQELIAALPTPTATPTAEVTNPPTPSPTAPPIARPTLRTVVSFRVSGIVVDSVTNQPVPNVQVTAYPLAGSFASAGTAVTEVGGSFAFTLPADTYRLRLTSVFGQFRAQDWTGTLSVDRDRLGVFVRVLRPSE